MWPDRVSNPGPQTNESGALPIALRSLANIQYKEEVQIRVHFEDTHRALDKREYLMTIFLISHRNNML